MQPWLAKETPYSKTSEWYLLYGFQHWSPKKTKHWVAYTKSCAKTQPCSSPSTNTLESLLDMLTLSLSHVCRSQRSLSSSHVRFIWREWSLSCRRHSHLPTRLMGFLSSLRARRSRPAAFHVLQDIRQESQIVLLWMRGAHATGSPQQRQACVPPSAPCPKVNHQHMLEITFMFTAEDILCQTNAKLNVIHLRVVNVPGHLPAELP